MKLEDIKKRAKEYVEIEADTQVTSVEFVERHHLLGREDVVLLVKTTDPEYPEWWVVGGGTPMNLYAKDQFCSPDVAFSLHVGLFIRMMERQFEEEGVEPIDIGYDAFISHATEDKDAIVRPLALELEGRGLKVWYDEFELRVGDSLRESIDRGLVNSTFGIVVLSKAFFAKNWPKYELNSLTAMQMDGQSVILPIWHEVSRKDVLSFSPALADKVAVSTSSADLPAMVDALLEAMD